MQKIPWGYIRDMKPKHNNKVIYGFVFPPLEFTWHVVTADVTELITIYSDQQELT